MGLWGGGPEVINGLEGGDVAGCRHDVGVRVVRGEYDIASIGAVPTDAERAEKLALGQNDSISSSENGIILTLTFPGKPPERSRACGC